MNCRCQELIVHGDNNIFKNLVVGSLMVYGSGNYFDGVKYDTVHDYGDCTTFEN